MSPKKILLSALVVCGLALLIATLRPGEAENKALALNSPGCALPEPRMVLIEGRQFTMGSTDYYAEEAPLVPVRVDDFWISNTEVSNAEFAKFVADTAYVTVAEKNPDPAMNPGIDPGLLVPGSAVFVFAEHSPDKVGAAQNTWQFVAGTNWREPEGPGSSIAGREHHPAVHIAYADALAYADWKGHRLPSEAEYELAAAGSEVPAAMGVQHAAQANTWQGEFPFHNEQTDGFRGSAPVGCFAADKRGLHDMIGNVWEWTSTRFYPSHQIHKASVAGQGYDPQQPQTPVGVIKGGSFLCAANYCARYRPSARQPRALDFGSNHIGFRTAKSVVDPRG
nr:putative sulfatase modifying factor 1 precursor (C-alpha-formyglycine- generating enzyme 1) [uncultured bacterium]